MLSYSPRQIVTGFWQRALMPLVFCELALAYPPEKVSNPGVDAGGGEWAVHPGEARGVFCAGGHAAVPASVLEDVALARRIKRRKAGLRFGTLPMR
jgi:hypothetical protein